MQNPSRRTAFTAPTLAALAEYWPSELDEGTPVWVQDQGTFYCLRTTPPLPSPSGTDVIATLHQDAVFQKFDGSGGGGGGIDSFFDVKKYGAVGDGVVNDSPAIQSAIDAQELNGGGIIYFPVGQYSCEQSLILNSNAIIEGIGAADSVLLAPTDGSSLFLLSPDVSWTPSDEGQPFLLFKNMTSQNGSIHVDGSLLTGFADGLIKFENWVFFQGLNDVAVVLADGVFYSEFTNCQWVQCFQIARLGSNTQSVFTRCIFKQFANGTNGIQLNGPDHVLFDRCEFYDFTPNENPDCLLVPLMNDTQGFVYFRDCKFGSERSLSLSQNKYRLQVYNADSPDYGIQRLVVRGSEFLGPDPLPIVGLERNSNVATATVATPDSGHGLQVGDIVYALKCVEPSFCGDYIEVTGVGPTGGATQTFDYANTGPDFAQQNVGGVVGSLSNSAIDLKSNIVQSVFSENLVRGPGSAINDEQVQDCDPYGQSNGVIWDPSNVVLNPLGVNVGVFKSGVGRGFTRVNIEETDRDQNIRRGDKRIIELTQIRNRLLQSNAGNYDISGVSVTTGQTDPYGGSSAVLVSRDGADSILSGESGSWSVSEALSSDTILAGSPPILFYRLWAKADTSRVVFWAILDGNGFLENQLNIPLTTDWQEFEIAIPLNLDFGATLRVVLSPGGINAQPGSVYLWETGLSDFPGTPIVPTAGSAFVDTTLGNYYTNGVSFKTATVRQLATIAGLKSAGGGTPALTATTPVGTGGTYSLEAGSTDFSGVILVNSGTGPGNSGTVKVAFSTPITDSHDPAIYVSPMDGSNSAWGNTPGIHVGRTASGYKTEFNIVFADGVNFAANNLPASTADARRLSYEVIRK